MCVWLCVLCWCVDVVGVVTCMMGCVLWLCVLVVGVVCVLCVGC